MKTTVSVAALGASVWLPVSYLQNPFSVSLDVTLSQDAAGITYTVQHTFDNPQDARAPQSLTRSGAVATVIDPAHGLVTGDSLQVMNSGDPNLDTARGQGVDITVVDDNTYTYAVGNTGAAAGLIATRIVTLKVFNHAQMAALAARADGNYAFPVQAVRVKNTAWTGGTTSLKVIQSAGR